MNTKKCTMCLTEKPLNDFFNDKRVKRDGKTSRCKICTMQKNQEYRQNHKEERNSKERLKRENDPIWREQNAKRNKKYYKKLKEENGNRWIVYKERQKDGIEQLRKRHPAYFMWAGARLRARKNNIPFDLDIEDIEIPKYCPILEIPIIKNEGKACANSMSLDKIIPELGYIKGNVRVISRLANTMKQDASIQELKIFAKNIINYINNKDIVRTIEKEESIEPEDKELLG